MECFLELVPLKKADAETIYCTFIECYKKKSLLVGRIVGLGFDVATTFYGRRTEVAVQALIKKHTPHVRFVQCQGLCALSIQTPGIAHAYRTSNTL